MGKNGGKPPTKQLQVSENLTSPDDSSLIMQGHDDLGVPVRHAECFGILDLGHEDMFLAEMS